MELKSKLEKVKIIRELLEKDDPKVIDLLIENLKDKNKEVRFAATQGLTLLASPKAIPALVEALDDTNAEVRSSAIVALGELKSPQTIPNLVKALQDKNKNVRVKAACVLSKFPTLTTEAILALVLALEDSNAQVRIFAVKTLAKMEQEKCKAIIGSSIIVDKYNHIADEIKKHKQNIIGEKILSIFIKALDDSEKIVREQSALELIEIARKNEASISNSLTFQDVLIKIVEGRFSSYVRANALSLLGKFKDSKTTNMLMGVLQDTNSGLRDTAIEMSAEIVRENKTLAKEVIPILCKAVEDKNWGVRMAATSALGQIAEVGNKQAIAALSKALEDNSLNVYCSAIDVLEKIGDKQAVPALIKVSKSNKMSSYYSNKAEEIIPIVESR